MSRISNVHDQNYSEEVTLQVLVDNLEEALKADCDEDQITIIVNGIAHGFYLGGPQVNGIYEFVTNICDENLYDNPVDALYDTIPDGYPLLTKQNMLRTCVLRCLQRFAAVQKVKDVEFTSDESHAIDEQCNKLALILEDIIKNNSTAVTSNIIDQDKSMNELTRGAILSPMRFYVINTYTEEFIKNKDNLYTVIHDLKTYFSEFNITDDEAYNIVDQAIDEINNYE